MLKCFHALTPQQRAFYYLLRRPFIRQGGAAAHFNHHAREGHHSAGDGLSHRRVHGALRDSIQQRWVWPQWQSWRRSVDQRYLDWSILFVCYRGPGAIRSGGSFREGLDCGRSDTEQVRVSHARTSQEPHPIIMCQLLTFGDAVIISS